jgi:hypothetical protein
MERSVINSKILINAAIQLRSDVILAEQIVAFE